MTLHFLCCLIPGVCLVWQTFVEMEVWGKGFSCCGAIEFLVLCHVPWCNEMSWWWAIECCKWIGFTPANPCVWRESHSTCISFCLLTQSSCGSCFYTQVFVLTLCLLFKSGACHYSRLCMDVELNFCKFKIAYLTRELCFSTLPIRKVLWRKTQCFVKR